MDLCSRNPNRTVPVSDEVPRRANVPLCSRTNGWSWPPHPFQLLAWLLYLYFAVTGFGVFIPLLPSHWIPAGYIVSFVIEVDTWVKMLRWENSKWCVHTGSLIWFKGPGLSVWTLSLFKPSAVVKSVLTRLPSLSCTIWLQSNFQTWGTSKKGKKI